MPENADGSSKNALRINIKIPQEPKVVNIDYDDDIPEVQKEFVFRGAMTNRRMSIWEKFTNLFISPAEQLGSTARAICWGSYTSSNYSRHDVMARTPAWQRKAEQGKSGLNAKGRLLQNQVRQKRQSEAPVKGGADTPQKLRRKGSFLVHGRRQGR